VKKKNEAHAPYRTPDVPKGIGSFQWPSVLTGLASMLLWNIIATQFVAYRFNYAKALGETWIARFYNPFKWMFWMLHYSQSRNPFVKNTVLLGAGIVVLGCAATMMVSAVFNIRRTKNYMKGNEDLRGSARWATKEDILKETSLLTANDGVYVGGFRDGKRLQYLMHSGKEHFLAFAPTRSGKGVGLVIPTLLVWPDSVVVYDIKGENWAKTAGFRATDLKQYCLKFSPLEGDSSKFNPLAEIRLTTVREVSDAENIAQMIVNTGAEGGSENQYFIDEATNLVTGLILHVCYTAYRKNPNVKATLADVLHVLTDPSRDFHETMENILTASHRPDDYKPSSDYDPFAKGVTHPTVAGKIRAMLNKAEKDFSGVLSSATRPMSIFADPLVANCTSGTDFTIQDLVNAKRPASLYIIVPPSDRARLRPLVRLMFTMICNRLMEKMEFGGPANVQKNNKHRLLFLIDEFPSLKRMEVFADALSFMAGFGLKAYLIAQDVRQIVDSYGENESIVSNCHVRVAYAPNNEQTAEMLSRMTGTQTIQKANLSFSGTRAAPQSQQMSTSVEYVERPLLTADEVTRIKPAEKTGSGDTERITGPGDMLIFVAGTRPIYGTQILYFNDPELKRRSEIPAPTKQPKLFRPQIAFKATAEPEPATPQPPVAPETPLQATAPLQDPTPATSPIDDATAPKNIIINALGDDHEGEAVADPAQTDLSMESPNLETSEAVDDYDGSIEEDDYEAPTEDAQPLPEEHNH
jgi:type IV secretion system protein VirD4